MKDLARVIRAKLDDRSLPREEHIKVYGSHGTQLPCDACGQPILPAQVQYEVEFEEKPSIRLHLGCFGLYEAERLRRGWTQRKR